MRHAEGRPIRAALRRFAGIFRECAESLEGEYEQFCNTLSLVLDRFTGKAAGVVLGPPKGRSMRDKTKVAAALSTLVTLASVAGRAKGW